MGIQGNYRNLGEAFRIQSLMDEADVVRCPAHAAGLGHHEGRFVQVVLPGLQGPHERTDGDNGRIAGIVIDTGQTFIDICPYRW